MLEDRPTVRRARAAGKKGGLARALALSSDRRSEISQSGGRLRWSKAREQARGTAGIGIVDFGHVRLRLLENLAELDGVNANLTLSEFLLVTRLSRTLDVPVELAELRRAACLDDTANADRSVAAMISNIRRKLNLTLQRGFEIINKRKFGYMLHEH